MESVYNCLSRAFLCSVHCSLIHNADDWFVCVVEHENDHKIEIETNETNAFSLCRHFV